MKIYHFVLLFILFSVPLIIIKDMEAGAIVYTDEEALKEERIMEMAAEAATWELRTAGTGFDDSDGLRAVNAFFYSVYASKNMIDNPAAREKLKPVFPMFVITLNTGYHIFSITEEGGEYRYSGSGLIPYDTSLSQGDTGFAFLVRSDDGVRKVFKSYGAKVTDGKRYIVDKAGLYHEEGCEDIGEIEFVLFSKEGCVRAGAHPCRKCIDR